MVLLREVRSVGIRRYLESVNVIPTASASTYHRYIDVALSFLVLTISYYPSRTTKIEYISSGNNTNTFIGLFHLSGSQLLPVPPFELRIYVEGICYTLNDNVDHHKQGRLSTTSFGAYAIHALRTLRDFLRTVKHLCRDLETMMEMELKSDSKLHAASRGYVGESFSFVSRPILQYHL